MTKIGKGFLKLVDTPNFWDYLSVIYVCITVLNKMPILSLFKEFPIDFLSNL